MADLPVYTWNEGTRQFRDSRGRFVTRAEVRSALDPVLDDIASDIRAITTRLVAGEIDIEEWHGAMEMAVKESHTLAGALAAGGWNQARSEDWAAVGRKVKFQYQRLRDFARELENGLTLDGTVVARAEMYVIAATGTYEAVLRRGDLAAGYASERRILHGIRSCRRCVAHAAKGWQPAGVLPGIGEDCDCLSNCRCTFERKRSTPRMRSTLPMATPVANFNAERCRRRARLAAARDGVDATPLGFVHDGSPRMGVSEALSLVNAASGTSLTAEDVYIHFVEAANTRFIGDRFMFLDATTLKNIASAAESGIAFMNSHRTGGLSAPSELPFGKTFAGRYEEFSDSDGGTFGRTILGIYMLRGVHPNGAAGPSTDDLHRAIEAGTLSDVSMGLVGGTRLCDVCGEDLSARDAESGKFLCPHAPGTHRQMDLAQIEGQTARGVRDGKASYTLVDAMPQEVSAVYKGAVPGAGFRKASALSRAGGLTAVELSEARESYAGLLDADDRTFGPKRATTSGAKMDILKAFRFWQAAGEPEELNLEDFAAPAPDAHSGKAVAKPVEDAEKLALRAELDRIKAEREQELRDGLNREADQFADGEVSARRALPADKDSLARVYTALATADRERLEEFKALQSSRPAHDLTTEEVGTEPVLPKGSRTLPNGVEAPDGKLSPDTMAMLLSATPLGKAALDKIKGN